MTRINVAALAGPSLAFAVALATQGCGAGSVAPAPLDTRNEQCRFCRMSVSDARFAAQVVAPGEDAVFFDDLGCLTFYLKGEQQLPSGLVVYVADHRTREWTRAEQAVFTRVPGLDTPMGSELIAHASEASRAQDPTAAQGQPVALADVVPARALEAAAR